MKDKLFLLKPNFDDPTVDSNGKKYFCPYCVLIDGVIKAYPQLESDLEIIYLDFQRPRQQLVDLLGEANQGCPLLIVEPLRLPLSEMQLLKSYGDKLFFHTMPSILNYLAIRYGIGTMHP